MSLPSRKRPGASANYAAITAAELADLKSS
jgi:hypothetical protein